MTTTVETRFAQAVERAVAADTGRAWVLGDEALALAPVGQDSTRTGAYEVLDRYVEALNERGVSVTRGTLNEYRKTSSAWAPEIRIAATGWRVHQMLTGRRDLIRPGMTVTEAHKALGHRTNGRTGPHSSASDRADQVKDALQDPEVVAQVMADPEARTVLAKARDDRDRETADKVERVERDPSRRSVDQGMRRSSLEVKFSEAVLLHRAIVEELSTVDITDAFVETIAYDITAIDDRWSWTKEALDNRSVSLDAGLEALLARE